MAFFTGSNKKFLVFDIGNASVGGALVEARKEGDKPRLKFKLSRREEILLGEHLSFAQLLKNMLKAVEGVSAYLAKEGDGREGAKICVILASPWYSSRTNFVHISKEEPFNFTKDFLAEILKNEIESFKSELSPKTNTPDLQPIESEVIQTKLNGYETNDFLEEKVEEADMAIFSSVSQKRVLESLKDKILRYFPEGEVVFRSFPLAYFSVIKKEYPKKQDFLMIDVSGEITEVSLSRGGVLLQTATFPLGRNFVIRRIASRLKRDLSGASALFRLSSNQALSANEKEALASVLTKAKDEWLSEYQKIINILSSGLYVPGEIFLATDDDALELFSSWIAGEQFSQYLLTHDKFRVTPLSIGHSLLFEEEKGQPADEFLSLEAVFAYRTIGSGA